MRHGESDGRYRAGPLAQHDVTSFRNLLRDEALPISYAFASKIEDGLKREPTLAHAIDFLKKIYSEECSREKMLGKNLPEGNLVLIPQTGGRLKPMTADHSNQIENLILKNYGDEVSRLVYKNVKRMNRINVSDDLKLEYSRKGCADEKMHGRILRVQTLVSPEGDEASGIIGLLTDQAEEGKDVSLFLDSLSYLIDSSVSIRKGAMFDTLTGLYNRDHFERMYDLIERRLNEGNPVIFLDSDVNALKTINDRYGKEPFGNTLLQRAGLALERSFRSGDMIARWGGDEFKGIIVCNKPEGRERTLEDVVKDKRNLIQTRLSESPLQLPDGKTFIPPLSLSMKVFYPDMSNSDIEALKKDADLEIKLLKNEWYRRNPEWDIRNRGQAGQQ